MWDRPPVWQEAKCLLALVHRGQSVESVRELIAVSPEDERSLLAFAKECCDLAAPVQRVIDFRKAVLTEFNRRLALEHAKTSRQTEGEAAAHNAPRCEANRPTLHDLAPA